MRTSTLLLALTLLPLSVFAADVTGTWKSEFDSQIGRQKYTFTFKQDGATLTGKANSEAGERKREAELKEGKVDGDTVAFVELLNFQDNDIRITYKGTLSSDGNEIKFTREVGEFAKEEIVAKRERVPQSLAEASATATVPAATAVATTPPVTAVPVPTVAEPTGPAATPVLHIDVGHATGQVSPMFFGLMTEEINYSYEGGIYGELIRNRSFKADAIVPRVTPDTYEAGKYLPVSFPPDNQPRFWTTVGGASMVLDPSNPLNEFLNVSLKLEATSATAAAPVGIANGGYWGIPVQPKTTYTVSLFAKAIAGFTGPLTASLESADGKTRFASVEIKGLTTEWKKFEAKLKTKNVPASKDNVFKLTTQIPGTVWLQNVSLFPPTYKNRPNGNRADLMELLAAMKPKFLRLPGGNYVEGNAFNQRFNWKETIGPVEQRPGHPSCWGYWSTDGMGLLEYAEWCEDLDMEPVLAVFAGYCLGGGGHVEAGPKLEPYVQEALEEIEYLTGDATTTKWGARRAQHGHPKPFPLHYVEIGNEDWFDRSGSHEGRFTQFFDAIKAQYPHLKVISSVGHEQRESIWVKSRLPDLVDEHFYRNQQDMEANFHQYDHRSRAADQSKVFVGEWATRVGSPTPNMAGALGDAAWLCGLERNADVVRMECFAPLFVNVSQLTGNGRSMQWESDLIGYDALHSYGSPSYQVETLFAQNCGADILPVQAEGIPVIEQTPPPGRRGGTPTPRRVSALYYSATRDAKSGVIFLKVVNVDGTAQPVSVQLSGATRIHSQGQAVVLSANSPSDTNLINERNKLVPHIEKVNGLSANFTREFPPYSITVLKLKSK